MAEGSEGAWRRGTPSQALRSAPDAAGYTVTGGVSVIRVGRVGVKS